MKAQLDQTVKSPEQEALHIASLLYGYIWESLTPDEHDELDNWVGESDENMYLFEELTDEKNIKKALDWLSDSDGESMAKKLRGRITFSDGSVRVRFLRQARRYAVAASVILIISTSAFYFYTSRTNKRTPAGAIASLQTTSAQQGGTSFITLSDGTKVWLNTSSSISYPATFSGKDRRVTMKGEAYFEVAKNKEMPFIVEIADRNTQVQVLGTHFDINSYSDEPILKTTLLEGSIKISSGNASQLIKPGQQAQVTADHAIKVINTDVDQSIAWKNNEINGDNVAAVMRQFERWYNVEVVYEKGFVPEAVPCHFKGGINRLGTLEEALKVLEVNINSIHTKLEGKKLTVTS